MSDGTAHVVTMGWLEATFNPEAQEMMNTQPMIGTPIIVNDKKWEEIMEYKYILTEFIWV
jgi:hypothetical protein